MDDLFGVGPYSMYPRGSVNEARHVLNLTGGCYRNRIYRARARVVLQNKNMYAQYRGVGHPVACLAGEVAIEAAARSLGIDVLEMRRRNLIAADAYPYTCASGVVYERLSHHECLDKIARMMDYAQKAFEGGVCTNGTQASYLEVDIETGEITLLKHWVVESRSVT